MAHFTLNYRRLFALTALTVLLVGTYAPIMHVGVLAADAWADPDCSYRMKLTFGNSASSENFTNFPVLVVLNSARISYGKTNATDIRFYDGSTLLPKETELWNVSGNSYVWVKVPQIDNSNTDYIYAYYNATSSRNDDDAASVWSDYTMVQHLEETSGTLTDSTANHHDGAAYGGVTLNTAGEIDGADDYSGTNSYSVINNSTAFNFTTNSFSYLFWFKSRATTTQYLFSKKLGTLGQVYRGYMMGISSDNALGYSVALGDGTTNARINTGNHASRGGNVWTMFAVVVDRTQQNMTVYIDGVLKGNASISAIGSVDNNMNFTLGKQADAAGAYFNGALDEVCVLSASRSASWAKAQYLSTSDQFITYGGEETPSGTTPLVLTVTSPLNSTTYYSTTVTLSGSTNLNANVTYKLDSQADVSISNGTQTFSTDITGLSYGSHAVTVNVVETGNPTNTNSSIVYFNVQPVPWADPACHYRVRLTFNNSASSENLTDFPVLVVLNSARIDYSKTSATDIRFYDWSTLLSKETELWNASGNSYIWVKVPQIDSSNKDYIYAYYNCSSSSNLDDAASVWSDYAMVQHLEESSGTVLTDSTSNHNDGVPYGLTLDYAGKIDGGDYYDGTISHSDITDASSLNFGTNSFSYSFWFNTANTSKTQDILDKKGGTQGVGPAGYKMTISSVAATGLSASVSDGTNSIRVDTGSVPEWNGSVWAMFTVVVNRTSQLMLSYVNGVQKASGSIATVGSVSNSLNLRLGNDTSGLARGYYGGLDEVRICSSARSASWTYADYLSTSDQFITFGSEEFHNDAPNKPSNPSPSNGATGVPTSTTLSANVTDPQGDPMNVSFYQLAPSPPENFTIIVLPDTQYYSASYPQIFDNQTQWAANNAGGMNIAFVTHEGDLIDGYNVPSEWNNANHSMSILNGHIPWAIAPGNHDVNDVGNTTNFNIYFNTSRFTGKSWYGGAYNNDNANSFELFTQGTDKYLIFHIQYDPPDGALAWANQIIGNYSDRRVIVTTHEYLSGGSRTSIGDNIWQKFISPHADQIFLVLSGHSSRESRRSDTVNSHTVYQVEADYQGDSNGGNGWLRLLQFKPLEDKIYVKTYSPYLNSYETDSDSQFALDYNMTGTSTTPTLIGTATNVASGGVASIPWNGLSYSTTYQWYAVANDTSGATNQSDTWNFTTTTLATYTLNVSTVGSGSVDLNNTGPYYFGDVVQLNAVPATGWTFDHWDGDMSGSINPSNILINGNKNVTATFTQNTYTLTVSTDGSGSVNRNNTGPYHYGDTVELTADPTAGWSFDHWNGDLSGSINPTTILINNNKTVTAAFTRNTYTLTVTTAGSGSVNLNNSGPYYYGDIVQLTAVPTVGWSFDHWSGDLGGSLNPTTILINGNKAATATFTQNTYTLNVSIDPLGRGSVDLNNSGPYHYGDTVQLTALPTAGWSFDHWSGDLTGSTNPTTISINGSKAVTATFTQNEYTLDTSIVGSGIIDLNNTGPYHYGDVVELNAVHDVGWSFDHWSGDLLGSTNPTTIVMTDNKAATATFTQNTYTLTVNVVGNGVVNRNQSGPYHYNDVVQLTAVPSLGWSFDHWSGDLGGSTNPDTVTITGNKIVTATFTRNTYTLTVSTVGSGSVTRNNTGPYYYGDVVQLTGFPDSGWKFDHWSGDLSGSTNPHTIVMTDDKSVTAHFTALGTRLYIDPSLVEKGPSDIGTTFDVNVTVQYVNDMWGFDFNLTWDNALLTQVGVDFNTTLDQIWGADGWFAAHNESGAGYYQLAVVATSHGFNTTTAAPLARITFKILDPLGNSLKETAIHFQTHKLSNSSGTPIAHTAEDGLYRISGGKPTLTVGTGSKTCRMYNETFTVQVNVTNAGSVEDFRFEIRYNATLLDVVGINWNAWGSGTYTADEVNGILTGYTSGSPLSGNVTLLTITFNATYHHMWKDESTITGWKNIQTGTIYIQWANLSYPTGPELGYVKGGLNQINVGSDFEYSFSPIRGDVDNNGRVDVFDIRTIAAQYDTSNPDYNLTGDNTIDIFDLVVVGSNFGYSYVP